MTEKRPGAHRAPEPERAPDRPEFGELVERVTAWISGLRVRTVALAAAGMAVVLLALTVGLSMARPDPAPPPVEVAAATSAPAVPNVSGQPQPGPTPASGPVAAAQAGSQFGINAQALLDEMRKHDPNISDADAAKLVEIGDAAIARNQPDLTADDPQIRQSVRAAFPDVPEETAATMTRCTAEYAERQWALLHNTSPPDSGDDHGR